VQNTSNRTIGNPYLSSLRYAANNNRIPLVFHCHCYAMEKLLKPDKYKDNLTGSMKFLVTDKRVKIFSFVIMDNYIHLIWQMLWDTDPDDVQRDFLKYTAHRIKKDLQKFHPEVLVQFKVDAKDREYQFWKRNPLSVELRNHAVFRQKLDYIHWNPVKAGMCKLPEEYKYSSALFYEIGIDNWGFLEHYRD
jgi:putative transposase